MQIEVDGNSYIIDTIKYFKEPITHKEVHEGFTHKYVPCLSDYGIIDIGHKSRELTKLFMGSLNEFDEYILILKLDDSIPYSTKGYPIQVDKDKTRLQLTEDWSRV